MACRGPSEADYCKTALANTIAKMEPAISVTAKKASADCGNNGTVEVFWQIKLALTEA